MEINKELFKDHDEQVAELEKQSDEHDKEVQKEIEEKEDQVEDINDAKADQVEKSKEVSKKEFDKMQERKDVKQFTEKLELNEAAETQTEIKELLSDYLLQELEESRFMDNLALRAENEVPGYNPDWCAEEASRDYKEKEYEFIDALADDLMAMCPLEESLKEDLMSSSWGSNFQSDVYNALADIAFKYYKKNINITEDDWNDAIEWFMTHFFESDDNPFDPFGESLEEAVSPDLINAIMWHYGCSKTEANKQAKGMSEERKKLLIQGFKDNAKKSFYSESLKESRHIEYIEKDLADKSGNNKIEDAYDENELTIIKDGNVWYCEHCPEEIYELVKKEMKKQFPELKWLYENNESLKEDNDANIRDLKDFSWEELEGLKGKTIRALKNIEYGEVLDFDEEDRPNFKKAGLRVRRSGDIIIPKGWQGEIVYTYSYEGANPELGIEVNDEYIPLAIAGGNAGEFGIIDNIDSLKENKLNESDEEDLKKDANSLSDYLSKNKLYCDLEDYELYPMGVKVVTFRVEGDWKHDHWYFEDLVRDWAKENGKEIFKMDSHTVEEDGSDYYTADHKVYITDKETSDRLNSMRGLFAPREESLNESKLDEAIPREVAQALKNSNNQEIKNSGGAKYKIPGMSKYRTSDIDSKDALNKSNVDYEKAEFRKISKEEALNIYKTEPQNLLLIVSDDHGYGNVEQKAIWFDVNGDRSGRAENVPDEKAPRRRDGSLITDTKYMTIKQLIDCADSCYWTNQRDVTRDPVLQDIRSKNPESRNYTGLDAKDIESEYSPKNNNRYVDNNISRGVSPEYGWSSWNAVRQRRYNDLKAKIEDIEAELSSGNLDRSEKISKLELLQDYKTKFAQLEETRTKAVGAEKDYNARRRYLTAEQAQRSTMKKFLDLKNAVENADWDLKNAQRNLDDVRKQGGTWSNDYDRRKVSNYTDQIRRLQAQIADYQRMIDELNTKLSSQQVSDEDAKAIADAEAQFAEVQNRVQSQKDELNSILDRARARRQNTESLEEDLKVTINFDSFEPYGQAVDTYNRIKDANKLDEADAILEELYPDGIDEVSLNDILAYSPEWLLNELGLADDEEKAMLNIK